MLHLLKSSRYLESLQESLRLLTAPPGERVIVRTPLRLLGGFQGAPAGTPILLVLADPPFAHPAPLRLGRVEAFEREEPYLEIRLVLGGYPDGPAAKTYELGKEPQPVFERAIDLEELPGAPGFQSTVDRLLASDGGARFQESGFLLPLGLQTEAGESAPPDGLVTGQTYRQPLLLYNPHLSDRAMERLHLGQSFDRSELELLGTPARLPRAGEIALRFRPLGPGVLELELHLNPRPERSVRTSLRYRAAGTPACRQNACAEVSPALSDGLRGLLSLLEKRGALEEPAFAGEVLTVLISLLPGDAGLRLALARHCHRVGEANRADELFAAVDPAELSPSDWVARFISAARARRPREDLLALAERLPWDWIEAPDARSIGEAVASLPEETIIALLETLAYYSTERFLRDIWSALRPAIRTPFGIAEAHRILRETHLDAPSELYAYVSERIATLDLADASLDALLLQDSLRLEVPPPDLDVVLDRHMKRLTLAGQVDQALVWLESSRSKLSGSAFEAVRHRLAEALIENGGAEAVGLAGRLFADMAEAARLRGDLEEAALWLERSAGVDPEGERLREVQPVLERAVEAVETTQTLYQALAGHQLKKLRDALKGRRLTIVGGPHEKPWVDTLRRDLAASEIVWYPSQLGKQPRPDKLREALGPSTGAVAVLTFFIGHQAAEAVREEARRRGIPCAFVSHGTSRSALLQALFRAILV